MRIQDKEISHRIFSSEFKPIRTQKDLHLGEHTLMRNTNTRRRVIVKTHECPNKQELNIILKDYQNLNQMHMQTNNLCDFVGYYLEEIRDSKSKIAVLINLIYDYHQATLQQQINSMILKSQHFQEKQLQCFLSCTLRALAVLEKYGLNFLNLRYSNVLVEGRNTIQLSFRLFYTPYLYGAVSEIKENRSNIDDYNLSEHQLKLINSSYNFHSDHAESSLDFKQKLRVDKQSLGLMMLRMATLTANKHGLYTVNEKNQLIWDLKQLENKMEILNKNYSKQLVKKVQYLLTGRQFWGFETLPTFMLPHQGIHQSRLQKSSQKSFFRNSRSKSPRISSNKKYLDISASKISQERDSRISKNDPFNSSSIARLKGQSLSNSKSSLRSKSPSPFSSDSPTKSKANKYEKIKAQIQEIIYGKIQQQQHRQQIRGQDGSDYIGGMRGGKKNGFGICYFKEGDIYAGEWRNDQIQGNGSYLFQNCDLYRGQVQKGLKHGRGKYIYENGNYYEGEWKNDKKDGYGVFYNKDKNQKYEGHWLNGIKQGSGIYIWKNGDKFQGGFSQGLKSGSGVATKYDGTKITGQWYNDQIRGVACIKYRSGTSYTGEIKLGNKNNLILDGKGQQITNSGSNYEGDFVANKRNGKCCVRYANGDTFQGLIKDDKFDGEGKYFYRHLNCFYIGCWKNGLQTGKGILEFNNGTKIQCIWVDGRPSEYGKIMYQNGDIYEGEIGRLGRNGKGTYWKSDGIKIIGNFRNGVLILDP